MHLDRLPSAKYLNEYLIWIGRLLSKPHMACMNFPEVNIRSENLSGGLEGPGEDQETTLILGKIAWGKADTNIQQ